MKPLDLTKLPIFDSQKASCDTCELQKACARGHVAYAYRPKAFNGVMIIGEGPGRQEVVEGRPFVGPAGRLLRDVVGSVGLDLDSCYITNATTCKGPPIDKKKTFLKAFPNAVTSCLPRLEAEIEAVKPRIILALGATAWAAVSGYDRIETRLVEFDCAHCDEKRRVGPVLQCSAPVPNPADGGCTTTACKHVHYLNKGSTVEEQVAEVELLKAQGCAKCGAKLKRVRPKHIKCPVCLGRKRRPEERARFTVDFPISKVAGGLFIPAEAGGTTRQAHELHHWLHKHGVEHVIPTYHPAHILRGQQFLAKTMQKHVSKAVALLRGAKPVSYTYAGTKDPTVVAKFVSKPGCYTVDIETIGKVDPEDSNKRLDARKIANVESIQCLGLDREDGETLVIDTREVNPSDPNDPLLAALFEFMVDTTKPKTFHHGGGYDLPVMDLVWGFSVLETSKSYADDTLGSHSNLYPDEPHDLAHVTFESALTYAWKPERRVKGAAVHLSYDELEHYNARDCRNTTLSREHHGVRAGLAIPGGRMDRARLSEIYRQDSLLRQEAVRMTMRGLPLDKEGWAAAGVTAQGHIDDALTRVREALAEIHWEGEFNPRSTPQKISVLYNHPYGYQLPKIAFTGNEGQQTPSTDTVTLKKLLASAQNPKATRFLQAMIDFLKHDYVARNFIYSADMKPWADDRIHAVWKPWGTVTGRFSSSPNFQNWPKWLRALVVAPKGRKIVGVDEDQLELRNMALLSRDPELITRCQNADSTRKLEPEWDVHSYVASHAFKDRYTSLSLKDPAHLNREALKAKNQSKCLCETCRRTLLRDITKRVIYGLNYGAGDATVLEAIYNGGYEGPPITLDIIGLVRRTVFREFAQIPIWRDGQVALAKQTGELRSPLFGRRRIFPLGDVPVTETYNFPIQSLGGDLMNLCTLELVDKLHKVDPSAFLIAQVHDAVYVEADERRAQKVADLLTEIFTRSLTINDCTMLFTATGSVADSWKDAA